jgi:transcriptional regulator with XRE-family HTH domain
MLSVNKNYTDKSLLWVLLNYGSNMTDLRKVLASNMKFYRNQRGLSQEKLAEVISSATNYIALIETGRRFPSLKMLEKLAKGLKVDTLQLFSLSPSKTIAKKALQTKILVDIEQILAVRLDEMGD